MLNGKVEFNYNSDVATQNIDNIVKGDDQSFKLIVKLHTSDNVGYQDLSDYVVTMQIERPDDSITPSLSLSLNYSDTTERYIIIDKEITAIAGINDATVRFRLNGELKNTGLIHFEVQDSVIPTEPTITEAQLNA